MKAKITYARLQERVAEAAGITKKEAQNLLGEMTAAVGAGLVTDGKVNLAGLGRFARKVQGARKGRNPRTGESIDIPEKNRVDFLPEAKWRRDVNREYEKMRVVPPHARSGGGRPPDEKKSLPLQPPGQDRPPEPVDTETDTRAISPPAPQIGADGDIPPEEKTTRDRRARLVPGVCVILVLAAVLIFLWPRFQSPVPPKPARLEPVLTATGVTPRPAETARPEPEEPAVFETAAVEAAETAPPKPPPANPGTVSGYTVAAGDSLWKIAHNVYNYPYFWPVLFKKNHKTLQHPDSLIIGMQLAVPAFEGRFGQLTEPEFQQLADGYLQVYRAYRRHDHPRAPYYLWVAYRLRAHWVPENELVLGQPEDLKFIRQLKGRGLIH